MGHQEPKAISGAKGSFGSTAALGSTRLLDQRRFGGGPVNVGYCLTGRSSRRWAKFLDSWPVPGGEGYSFREAGVAHGGGWGPKPISRPQ